MVKGSLCAKISTKKEEKILIEYQVLKTLISMRIFYLIGK